VLVSGFAESFQIKRGKISSRGESTENPFFELNYFGVMVCVFFEVSRHDAARRVLFCLSPPHTKETSMSDPTEALKANTDDVPREILDLAEAIHSLPAEHRSAIEPLLTHVIDSNRRRRRILLLVQDALSQLRLDMKYMAFDLEATRRERDDYRRQLGGTA
jgi:hypothetical protein